MSAVRVVVLARPRSAAAAPVGSRDLPADVDDLVAPLGRPPSPAGGGVTQGRLGRVRRRPRDGDLQAGPHARRARGRCPRPPPPSRSGPRRRPTARRPHPARAEASGSRRFRRSTSPPTSGPHPRLVVSLVLGREPSRWSGTGAAATGPRRRTGRPPDRGVRLAEPDEDVHAAGNPAASPVRASVANEGLRHWLIGYARVSKTDGSQSLEPDALGTAGVDAANVYHHLESGGRDDRGGQPAQDPHPGRTGARRDGTA